MCCGSITHRKKVRTQDVKTSHAQILPAVFVPQHRYNDSEPFVVDRIRGTRNVVSNAGSDPQTSSGSNDRVLTECARVLKSRSHTRSPHFGQLTRLAPKNFGCF